MTDTGQIKRGSKLGEHIYEISKMNDVKFIVDIGTWLGLGSTKCILDGLLTKKTPTYVYSLECNRLRLEQAKINLGFLPPNFNLIHGTIVNASELEPMMDTLENDTLKTWLKEDLDWLRTTPNVLNDIPEQIDLCIIDGGEFSGNLELMKLWKRCRYIVLDDTKATKHQASREFILSKPDVFIIIEDNTTERNGFLICKRKN